MHEWCLWKAILLKAPGVLCWSKGSFLHYGSRVISSIRLSGCLYVILAIRAVLFWLIVCSWGDALGTWASIRLTFVLLLDVCIAQAHQSHLEAENSHFAISSTREKKENKTKKKTCKVRIFERWIISNHCALCCGNIFIHWLSLAGRKKSVEELLGSKQNSTGHSTVWNWLELIQSK